MEEGKMSLAKMKEGRSKEEVMVHGHGLRERWQGVMHTHQLEKHTTYIRGNAQDEHGNNIMQYDNEMGMSMQYNQR